MRRITDAGHGWLEVSLKRYPDATDYSTGFGYAHPTLPLVYLEEDYEAPTFMKAKGIKVSEVIAQSVEGDSIIRTYKRLPKVLAV